MNKIIKDKFFRKPSRLVSTMIDGLSYYSDNSCVTINMDTYGNLLTSKYEGCAGTWTLAKAFDMRPEDAIKAWHKGIYFRYSRDEVYEFQAIINAFRMGISHIMLINTLNIFEYNSLPIHLKRRQIWYLHSNDWKVQIKTVCRFRDSLITLGY